MIDALTYARCLQLLSSFWSAMDHRQIDDLMSLTTDDIRWQRERMYEGKSAVREAIAARPANLQIRHLMTNLVLNQMERGVYDAQFILAPVFVMADAGTAPPYQSNMFENIAEFRAGIVDSSDSLLVSSITFEMLFERVRTVA